MQREAGAAATGAGELLDEQGAVAEIAAGAAVLLRQLGAQQPGVAGLQPQAARHDAVVFPLPVMRHDVRSKKRRTWSRNISWSAL